MEFTSRVTNKTLIKKLNELGMRYIKIGIYFQNLAMTLKNNDFKENKEFKKFVSERLDLTKKYMS